MSNRRVAGGFLAVSLVGSILAHSSAVLAVGGGRAEGLTITERTITPGLVYRRIVDPAGPWVIHELDVDMAQSLPLDTITPGRMGSWARTSAMADAAGALAAVNGDFSVWPGRPMHPFTDDRSLKGSGLQEGGTFGVDPDGAPMIRHGVAAITATDEALGSTIDVATWNTGPPALSAVAGFTPYGGTAEEPPVMACSVRLATVGKLQSSPEGDGFVRDYEVVVRRCRTAGMQVRPRTIVLSSKLGGAGSVWIKGLRRGGIVRAHWDSGLGVAPDVLGGAPVLVRHGAVVVDATCSTWFCGKNPRTGVGYTADGHVLMVVVDGRSSESVGMTLVRFAEEMQTLGATNALNLDGGGSSTLWIDGMGVVNVPSDTSGERLVTSALVVMPAGKPIPSYESAPGVDVGSPVGSPGARAAMGRTFADRGSTGGLLSWSSSGR
jgi:Phosphodiester glycosidase